MSALIDHPPIPETLGRSALHEQLLRDPQGVAARIIGGEAEALSLPLVRIAVAGAVVYGLAIGLPGGMPQALISAVKLPLVLLGAASLSLPVLHVACQQAGRRLDLRELSALLLQALATACLTMACLAPLVTVAWLTVSLDLLELNRWFVYRRVVLAGLGVAAVGSLLGARQLARSLPLRAMLPWTASFGLAALQLTWLFRPVIGMPDRPLVLWRALESNALTEVLTALLAALLGSAS